MVWTKGSQNSDALLSMTDTYVRVLEVGGRRNPLALYDKNFWSLSSALVSVNPEMAAPSNIKKLASAVEAIVLDSYKVAREEVLGKLGSASASGFFAVAKNFLERYVGRSSNPFDPYAEGNEAVYKIAQQKIYSFIKKTKRPAHKNVSAKLQSKEI